MTERITPEQIATLRRLHEGRTPGILTFESHDGYDNDGMECMHDIVSVGGNECLDILDTSDEGCTAYLVAAANAIIPALDALAAAEQWATMSDAHTVDAYRLVDEVMHLADRALYSDDPAERMEKAGQLQTLWNLTLQEALAATAPATQPDERAAAERALLDRLAKRILAEIVYCAPENRALAEEVARVARIETDLIVSRDDATDGAAKEY